MVAALRDYEQAWRRDSAGMDRQVARALTDLATAQSTLARALHRFDRVLGGTLFKRPAVERPPAAREVQRLAQHVQRFYSARVLPEGVATGARPPDPDPTDGPTPAGAEPVVVTVADYRTLQITFARLAATDPPWVMLADAGFASWLDSLIRAAGGRTTGNHKLLGAAQLLEEAISAAPHPPAPAGREPQTPTLGPALAPQALVEILGQLGIGTIQQTKMTTTYHALAEKVTQQRQAALHDPVWQAAWAVFQVAAALAEEMERVTHEAPASSGVRPFARRVGRVLHEQIGIVLHTPGRVPAQVPVATMVWVESGVFRRPRAVAAAREAVSAAVGLFPPARAVGDLDRYKAELVALCMPGSGPLARLCEQVAPFGEVASAILVGARGAAFADIQAALAAGQPAQARNWFEAATR